MKKCKIFAAITLLCAICVSFCACGLSEEDVIGTWSCSYEFNGDDFYVEFILSENGEYSKIYIKNNSLSDSENGTWSIEGRKVCLFENENNSNPEYKYKDGKLINGGHEFTKQ